MTQIIGGGNNTPPKKSRIEFIDLAKGVCIFLVVALHCSLFGDDLPNFKAVRMPLYFILSGLFFKDYGNALLFIQKKINRMVVPFLFFILVLICLIYAFQIFITHSALQWQWLYEIFTTDRKYVNNPVWFLICLFFVNILFLIIHKLAKGNTYIIVGQCLLCGFIGFTLSHYGYIMALHFDTALTAMPFFCIGRLLGNTKIFFPNKFDRYSFPIGCLAIALSYGIFLTFGTQHIDFRDNQYTGFIPLIYLNSVLFTLGIMFVCKALKHVPVLSYIGRYSIIVLCTHYIFIYFIGAIALKYTGENCPGIISFAITLLLCIGTIPLCRKFIPHLCAQKDLIRIVKS